MFDPTKPYYELPRLPPKHSLDSIELLKALVDASTALAKLSAIAENLPNQKALYQSVILLEAKASSEIEQIITTDEKLFSSSAIEESFDPMTKEVHRYGRAIHHGWSSDRPLCTPLIAEICSIIKNQEMDVRKVPGTALKQKPSEEIIYTPPDGEELLRDLLDNLFSWMNQEDDVHPIIKSAIAHYQFESIHPFTDGNGRTGRIMMVLYLVEQNLLSAPVLFLSGEILKNKDQYYKFLQTTRESQNFIPYLIWFVNLIHLACLQSIVRAREVRVAMQEVKNEIRSIDSTIYSQDLVNVLFIGPIVFAKDLLQNDVVGSISTAHLYLKKLESIGILTRASRKYGRKVGYINGRLLDALRAQI